MKKFLLSLAAMALAVSASAYTTTAVTSEYEPEEGDVFVSLADPVNVDVDLDNSSITLKAWMGVEGYDLQLFFDEEENVTKMVVTQPDAEPAEYEVGAGYVSTYTGNTDYYYMMFYFMADYQYACAEEDGGYVYLCAYAYKDESTYDWAYYYLSFDNPEAPEAPEALYIFGNLPEGQWALPASLEMEKEGSVFTADFTLTDANEGNGYFAFTSSQSTEWEDVNAARWGGDESAEIVLGEAVEVFKGADATFKLPAGSYSVAFDFAAMEATFAQTEGGIEVAVVDFNAPVEYFNLQGVRVDNPVRGQMVIARQGNAVSKYIVR